MSDSHVVSALKHKRTIIAGQIEHTQAQVRQLVINLDNIDATLRLFDPEIDFTELTARPVPPAHQAFRGELSRIALSALRRSTKGPLTTEEIALEVMAGRGLDPSNKQVRRLMIRRVGGCLRAYREKGILKSKAGDGEFNLWEIVR